MGHVFDTVTPHACLADVVLPAALSRTLGELVGLERAKRTLVGQWGFGEVFDRGMGTTALFHGLPGTGKTLAAEAVAFELGPPIRRVNAAQLVSKWVGEGTKNLETVFREARQNEAILLFDEADVLFGTRTSVASATDRYANLEVAVLLRELEAFPGVAILTSNLIDNMDHAFRRRFRFILEFPAPDVLAREELWRRHLPRQAPLAGDVAIPELAAEYELTGAQIRNAVVRGAAAAALRSEAARAIGHSDLAAAAAAECRAREGHRLVGFQRPA